MAYDESKPAPTDRLKDSQADIQTNFADIKTAFDVNHEALTGAGGDEGKHKFIDFTRQGASRSTAATDVALFAKLSTLTNTTELFFRNQNDGTEYEFTSFGPSNSNGYVRFPAGILVKWGLTNVSTVGGPVTATITFPVASRPAFATIPIVFAQPTNISVSAAGANFLNLSGSVSTTKFDLRVIATVSNNLDVLWLAIGS